MVPVLVGPHIGMCSLDTRKGDYPIRPSYVREETCSLYAVQWSWTITLPNGKFMILVVHDLDRLRRTGQARKAKLRT
ncbi:MAG: hypothetical protein EWM73_02896 [Nitrospira sp.]|nr:MAG: hypothetical protein EWM73_02896 [Nitrospira sp.]